MFQIILFALIVGFSFLSMGGDFRVPLQTDPNVTPVVVALPTPGANERGLQNGKDSLQLETFGYVTVTPIPSQIDIPTVLPTPLLTKSSTDSPITTLVPTMLTDIQTSQQTITTSTNSTPQVANPTVIQTNTTTTYCGDIDSIKSTPSCTCIPPEEDTVYCKETNCQATDHGSYSFFTPPNVDGRGALPNGYSCMYGPNDPLHDQKAAAANCISACIGKPVIYLYPLVDTIVNVNVTTLGSIVVSDPLYPSDGWKNVLAHPSGSFDYQGKSYHELFYETSVTKVNQPPTGIIIPQAQLQSKLTDVTTQLGLLPAEQHEFLSYWLPKLHALDTPYILFSLLPPHEKDRVDHVDISPAPDTMIDFIAYFKPLPFPQPILPLQLPNTPPLRNGFTAVEWGGTIAD